MTHSLLALLSLLVVPTSGFVAAPSFVRSPASARPVAIAMDASPLLDGVVVCGIAIMAVEAFATKSNTFVTATTATSQARFSLRGRRCQPLHGSNEQSRRGQLRSQRVNGVRLTRTCGGYRRSRRWGQREAPPTLSDAFAISSWPSRRPPVF